MSHSSPSVNESQLDSLALKPDQSHPEKLPPILDPKDNSLEAEDDYEEEEVEEGDEVQGQEIPPTISSGMPSISDSQAPVPNVTLAALPGDGNARRGGNTKRKKGKGKGKGKPNVKKQQAIEEKVQTLKSNLNPIPFSPPKALDFAKHEGVLKRLGLWDFVQIDFDKNIKVDLIAELLATYDPKSRASYVKGYRIMVSRADLARAIKLPRKKEKGGDADPEAEAFSDDSIGFIVEIVSDRVLLHEDMWMMPNEVMEWLKTIKEGHPEKVDWAGLFWFMVEKELKQGSKLRDCYYASHLQHLIKHQREEVFVKEEVKVELAAIPEVKGEEEEGGVNEEDDAEVVGLVDGPEEGDHVMAGPSTELTLGQDGEKEEGTKDANMMDVENCKVSDEEGEGVEDGDGEGEEEHGQWLLDGRNDLGEHFMQPCDGGQNGEVFGDFEVRKEDDDEEEVEEEAGEEMDGDDDDEEEAGNDFHVFPNDHSLEGDGFTGNLLQTLEGNHMPYNTVEQQLHSPSSGDIRADMQHIGSTHSFLNSSGKRVMDDNRVSHHRPLGDGNKRLRVDESWEQKPADLASCFDQIQHWTEKARNLCDEKEQALEHANMNQQILLTEIQRRDAAMEHLHKSKVDEVQKKDREIYRLERELYLMETVLEGYRNALKETQKAFADYRERARLPEESTYKDVGPGGLMLTAAEIEKLEKKREEEHKANCVILEQKLKEADEYYGCEFGGYFERITLLDQKLTGLEANFKSLTELHASRKIRQTEEKMAEDVEAPPILETKEKPAETGELLPISETGEEGTEVTEKVAEACKPLPITGHVEEATDVTEAAAEAGEPLLMLEPGEEMIDVTEKAGQPLLNLEPGKEVPDVTEIAVEVDKPLAISKPGEEVPEVTEPYPIAQTEDEIMTETDETTAKQ